MQELVNNEVLNKEASENEPNNENEKEQFDSVVLSIMKKFQDQGVTCLNNLCENQIGLLDWIDQTQNEHMNAILYLEKLKHMMCGSP